MEEYALYSIRTTCLAALSYKHVVSHLSNVRSGVRCLHESSVHLKIQSVVRDINYISPGPSHPRKADTDLRPPNTKSVLIWFCSYSQLRQPLRDRHAETRDLPSQALLPQSHQSDPEAKQTTSLAKPSKGMARHQ